MTSLIIIIRRITLDFAVMCLLLLCMYFIYPSLCLLYYIYIAAFPYSTSVVAMNRLDIAKIALSYDVTHCEYYTTEDMEYYTTEDMGYIHFRGEIIKIVEAKVRSETYDQLSFKKLRNLTIVSKDTTVVNKSWRFPVLLDDDQNECYAYAYLFCDVDANKIIDLYLNNCILCFHADDDGYMIVDNNGIVSWALVYTNSHSHIKLADANVLYDYPQQLYTNGDNWENKFKLYNFTHNFLTIKEEEEVLTLFGPWPLYRWLHLADIDTESFFWRFIINPFVKAYKWINSRLVRPMRIDDYADQTVFLYECCNCEAIRNSLLFHHDCMNNPHKQRLVRWGSTLAG